MSMFGAKQAGGSRRGKKRGVSRRNKKARRGSRKQRR